jgi:hypothetical protein
MNTKNQDKREPPLPKDKPASYDNENSEKGKSKKPAGKRTDKGITANKSVNDSPQKTRENLEYDTKKREKDPGAELH